MVRIRVKIIRHDGVSKKEALWMGLHKAEAYVYKMVQSKEAFFLITDGEQAERILKPEIREFLKRERPRGPSATRDCSYENGNGEGTRLGCGRAKRRTDFKTNRD